MNKSNYFFYKSSVRFEIRALLFFRASFDLSNLGGWMEKPQILMWILLWKEGKNLVYLYEKLSILSIGGARLIFMNSSKCPTKSLIKKWDVVMSSLFAWRYSLSQYKRTLVYLIYTTQIKKRHGSCYILLRYWLYHLFSMLFESKVTIYYMFIMHI